MKQTDMFSGTDLHRRQTRREWEKEQAAKQAEPEPVPLTQAFEELREIAGPSYDGVDAIAFVASLRDDDAPWDDLAAFVAGSK